MIFSATPAVLEDVAVGDLGLMDGGVKIPQWDERGLGWVGLGCEQPHERVVSTSNRKILKL